MLRPKGSSNRDPTTGLRDLQGRRKIENVNK